NFNAKQNSMPYVLGNEQTTVAGHLRLGVVEELITEIAIPGHPREDEGRLCHPVHRTHGGEEEEEVETHTFLVVDQDEDEAIRGVVEDGKGDEDEVILDLYRGGEVDPSLGRDHL
ncbi:hypothetical protein KEM54_006319, partial [Ascosphaera aggregata]